ncbi:MAG: hypothetical protein ACFFE1_09770 [Candidatus Thorarchaeota archaeon]
MNVAEIRNQQRMNDRIFLIADGAETHEQEEEYNKRVTKRANHG